MKITILIHSDDERSGAPDTLDYSMTWRDIHRLGGYYRVANAFGVLAALVLRDRGMWVNPRPLARLHSVLARRRRSVHEGFTRRFEDKRVEFLIEKD